MTKTEMEAALKKEQDYLFARVFIRGENGSDVEQCRKHITYYKQCLSQPQFFPKDCA